MGSAQMQGLLWGAGATDWANLSESSMTPVYEAVFDAIGLAANSRLLDAGCGAGLALQIAEKRGAKVAGLDAAKELLAIACHRLSDADLREGDLEELPYQDASFDAVTAFNSVQYTIDPVAALREMRRVTQAGSPVVVVTWAEAERCETRAVLAAIGQLLPPPPAGVGGPFAMSAPGTLEELLTSAGLTPRSAERVPTPFIYPDLDSAVRASLASGPARIAIERCGLDVTAEAITTAMASGRQDDGTYRHDNSFRYVIADA